jgi:hypothetical protein
LWCEKSKNRLIQNLSNGIEYDETKDEHNADLNKFIRENSVKISNFFEELAVKNFVYHKNEKNKI